MPSLACTTGDPRKEQSLHHFTRNGSRNEYEECIYQICNVLSTYDSDQRYPVYGFGAKKHGTLSHCFALNETAAAAKEVQGVDGILHAYRHAFSSGIAMSKPTNICEVIQEAGKNAQQSLVKAKIKYANMDLQKAVKRKF